ncbi:MAG: hypothetical protein FWD14_07990 [Treponema sp.]|nr:hypothetical protein [Treponema sp.]
MIFVIYRTLDEHLFAEMVYSNPNGKARGEFTDYHISKLIESMEKNEVIHKQIARIAPTIDNLYQNIEIGDINKEIKKIAEAFDTLNKKSLYLRKEFAKALAIDIVTDISTCFLPTPASIGVYIVKNGANLIKKTPMLKDLFQPDPANKVAALFHNIISG